jgi:V8-like Glu-specific endopeptidase
MDDNIEVRGYCLGSQESMIPFFSKGTVKYDTPSVLGYDMTTIKSNSGSPVLYMMKPSDFNNEYQDVFKKRIKNY